jgi:hypothetical protein
MVCRHGTQFPGSNDHDLYWCARLPVRFDTALDLDSEICSQDEVSMQAHFGRMEWECLQHFHYLVETLPEITSSPDTDIMNSGCFSWVLCRSAVDRRGLHSVCLC